MKFIPSSVFVSHAGLPSGLESRQDWNDFIDDIENEIEALDAAWASFRKDEKPTESDQLKYEATRDRLEELREQALTKWQSLRGNKPGLAC